MTELGFRVGLRGYLRGNRLGDDQSLTTMAASTLGLLAFLITFLTSVALTDFNQRRLLVVEDANAVGTVFLRAGYLPEPQRSTVRMLLQESVTLRLDWTDETTMRERIAAVNAVHDAIWAEAETLARNDPNNVAAILFVDSVNSMLDTFGLRSNVILQALIPTPVWSAVYVAAGMSFFVLGMASSTDGKRNVVALPVLVLTFVVVMALMLDLDRPATGLLRVGQQAILDLQATIGIALP